MLPNQSHAPTTTTLKIHRPALEKMGTILGPLWLVESECLTTRHERYYRKLRKLEASLREAAAELREILAECCQECLATDAEWDRFEQDRPTPEERVRLAEREAMAEAQTFSFTPDVDEHPVACGSCDLAIHAGANTSLDGERRCG